MAKTDESFGIKRYIQYVKKEVKLLRITALSCPANQLKYFDALSKAIDNYAKTHKLYIKYILNKTTFDEVKNILGFGDRYTFRYLASQRRILIDYIQEKEIEYFAKFPFEENEVVIDGEIIDERV